MTESRQAVQNRQQPAERIEIEREHTKQFRAMCIAIAFIVLVGVIAIVMIQPVTVEGTFKVNGAKLSTGTMISASASVDSVLVNCKAQVPAYLVSSIIVENNALKQ